MKAKKKSASLLMVVAMVVAVLLAVFVPTMVRAEEADNGETSASVTFEKGKLELQAVPAFSFGSHILDSSVNSFEAESDSVIRVSDARGTGEGWSLLVSLSPFKLGTEVTLQGAKIEISNGTVAAYGGHRGYSAQPCGRREWQEVLDGAGCKLSFLELPKFLVFEGTELPTEGAVIGRQDEEWKIVVEDSRVNKTPWRLDVSVVQPMTAQDGSQLMNSLIYVDGEGNRTTLGETPTTVHSSPGGQEIVDVQWQQNSGILLWLPPGAARSNTEYTTTLQWTLYDVP